MPMRQIWSVTILVFLLEGPFLAPAHSQVNNKNFTIAEYNTFAAAQKENSSVNQIKALDDFVSKYPNSALLVYVYPVYFQAYAKVKNYPKVIEYAGKLLALGDQADVKARYRAIFAWANAYNSLNSGDVALAAKTKELALAGIKLNANFAKPDGMEETRFEAEKKRGAIYLNATAGAAALAMKDFAAASEFFKVVQTLDPYDPAAFLEWRRMTGF
jgi:tetratricopeptide (TPR) repeat protein